MEDNQFLSLSTLFDSIGIIEKGIEKIYHFLLQNSRIDNLKDVVAQYDLTLKRGYKICSVLSDLELVQIYDRPMKIHLATPVIPLWQKIINNRIEELKREFNEKKEKAEETLDEFVKTYNLDVQTTQEFVEFIQYNLHNFDETYYTFLAESQCKIAIGIRYENDLISILNRYGIEDAPRDIKSVLRNGILKIKENLQNLDIQVIFNSELVKDLINSKEFDILSHYINSYDLKFKSINVHVTEEDFSNFNLTNNELVQPSFDPTNKLIGSYISRNASIFQIFYDKFDELFEKSVPINQFIKKQKKLQKESLTETQCFVLCLL